MSTDRELLQLAAKAAGLRGVATDLIPMGRLAFRVLPGDGSFHYWDPLTDDGDALRLAAKLGMVVVGDPYGDTGVTVQAGELRDTGVYEPSNGDRFAATRRAIVRAAAAIGESMP
jgi:hypothetical protein